MDSCTDQESFLPPPAVARGRRVVGLQRLNAGRDIRVARLTMQGEDGATRPESLIVKYLEAHGAGQGVLPRERLYFREEVFNYRFLDECRDCFGHAPRFLGETGDCLYLEDLGPGDTHLPNAQAMLEVAAAALVSLHASTLGQVDAYVRLRAKLGYPPREADLRSLHSGSDERSFGIGAKTLLDWSSVLLPGRVRVIEETLNHAQLILAQEQEEYAFVHNDLVSARQCVLRNGKLFLIDFEHGRYGHRLLDLAKTMMGKLEITPAGKLLHVHPSAAAEIAQIYRAQWRARTHRDVSDATWCRQVAAALCFQATAEIGQCMFRAQSDFLLGLVPTIGSFLERLDLHLKAIDGGSEFQTALGQLLQRMPTIRPG